jgi:hypothetical protein
LLAHLGWPVCTPINFLWTFSKTRKKLKNPPIFKIYDLSPPEFQFNSINYFPFSWPQKPISVASMVVFRQRPIVIKHTQHSYKRKSLFIVFINLEARRNNLAGMKFINLNQLGTKNTVSFCNIEATLKAKKLMQIRDILYKNLSFVYFFFWI